MRMSFAVPYAAKAVWGFLKRRIHGDRCAEGGAMMSSPAKLVPRGLEETATVGTIGMPALLYARVSGITAPWRKTVRSVRRPNSASTRWVLPKA